MAKRSSGRMARPRSSAQQKASTRGHLPQQPTLTLPSPLLSFGLRVLQWLQGPVGQQLLALAVICFGLLTFFTVAGLNSGALINAWARVLVFVFGWGAYSMAALISALGLLWLRHLVHRPTAWRWRPFLGWEIMLVGLLALTSFFSEPGGWHIVESGQGGGIVGWALSLFFSLPLGSTLTPILLSLITLLGVGLAFDVTYDDIRVFLQRLNEIFFALRAQHNQEDDVPWNSLPDPAREVPAASSVAQAPPPISTSARRGAKPRSKPARRAATSKPPEPAAGRPAGLPPLKLLKPGRGATVNQEDVRRNSRVIEETLAQFGVPARVTEVRVGPVVTQFGVAPGYVSRGADGADQRKVRVSQIASLADDLTLALSARSLRIEAPVPGRAVVGIEVPNQSTSVVSLRSILDSEAFRKCGKPLCFGVGLDVAGDPIVADLSIMPHLLVAGTTGSGKSVFVKALAASLVMNNSPEELRLVTVDPKMVELSHLNGLPHLLGRTETELEKIIRVLRWVAHEMDQRYKLFAASVARNLDDYNRKMLRKGEATLPRMVVLIDELADLMMSAPDETERTLTRIAQMARATGIHLVVATQRPSTDVVTGLIKANFPARVSFATTSSVDSRVIIDTPGAESLLGRGDMLFLRPDAAAPLRVQGCYISDDEIESLMNFWQKQAGATPSKAPWEVLAESRGPDNLRLEGLSADADLLERAVSLAKSRGSISSSGLQRRLRISYPRAARLMEEMEQMGIVGPQESAGRKRRVILGDDEA